MPESTHRGRTHSWNVAFERRLPLNVSVDVAYVGNKLVGGLPPGERQTININNVQHMGGGDTDRPYFASHGRQLDIEIYSPWRRTSYHALQVGVTRPFTQGLLLKGHYTLQPLEGAENRLRGSHSRGPGAQLGARQRRPASHASRWRSSTSCPGAARTARGSLVRALINDWQINGIFGGVQRLAVHGHRRRDDVEHAGQHADRRPRRAPVTKIGEIGANGYYYDPAAWAQPEGVRFGTARINQFRGPGGWNLDLSVFRSFRLTGTHRIEARVEAANVTNTTKFGNPTGNLQSGDFMRIFGLVHRRMRNGRSGSAFGTVSRD